MSEEHADPSPSCRFRTVNSCGPPAGLGRLPAPNERLLTGTRFLWLWRSETAQR